MPPSKCFPISRPIPCSSGPSALGILGLDADADCEGGGGANQVNALGENSLLSKVSVERSLQLGERRGTKAPTATAASTDLRRGLLNGGGSISDTVPLGYRRGSPHLLNRNVTGWLSSGCYIERLLSVGRLACCVLPPFELSGGARRPPTLPAPPVILVRSVPSAG